MTANGTRMRIALVITRSDIIGGASLHVQQLAESLQRRGHDVLVVVGGQGPFIAALRAAGLRVAALPRFRRAIRPMDDVHAYVALRRELAAFRPTVVSTHTSKAGALGRLAACALSVPATYSPHGWTFAEQHARGRRTAYAALERVLAYLPGTIVTVSHDEDEVGRRARIGRRRPRVTIHNGVADVTEELLARPDGEPPLIVSVARFEAPKDQRTLLRALAQLRDLDFRLQLVGDGPELAVARQLAADLGLDERVDFLGHRTDVAVLLSRAQVFALSSRSESFPMTVLEAMRAGLPVVASDVGGISEAVVDGHTGLLVRIAAPDAWADSLKHLLLDRDTRRSMGANGRDRYLARFGHDRMVNRVTSLYLELSDTPRDEVEMSMAVLAPTEDPRPLELARRSIAGDLPLRYQQRLEHGFRERVDDALEPGMRILDVGSGRLPCRSPECRPRDCHYVGLDISAGELAAAAPGSYDECVVADIAGPRRPELVGQFDVVVSFQVLEHVRPLGRALDNMHAYLRPGGRLVAQMSGTFTPFSLLGRVMPHRPKVWLLHHLLGREPAEIFPAYYDHCYASALRRLTVEWRTAEIVPLHRGASYLHFSKVLRALYLVYERGLTRRGLDDLAAYYIVDARTA